MKTEMKRMLYLLLAGLCLWSGPAAAQPALTSRSVPAPVQLPDARFAQGVSASYAGVSDTLVWWAGGCNFPDTPAADGGKKVYYDVVLVAPLRARSGQWRVAGRLPRAAAYGVGIGLPDGLLCIGGASASGPLADVWRLSLAADGRSLVCDTLPPLPVPTDNLCGALVGDRVYVAGGNAAGVPTVRVYSLSLRNPAGGWRAEASLPGEPRTQAVAVGLQRGGEDCLFVFGGFAAAGGGREASLSTSSLCYTPSTRSWTEVAAPVDASGQTISLGGGSGYAVDRTRALCLGGVDKDIFLAALRREAQTARAAAAGDTATVARLKAEAYCYMTQPPAAYRLNDRVLAYDAAADAWHVVARVPQAARAGAALAGRDHSFFWINGEEKPGIRSPQIWLFRWK